MTLEWEGLHFRYQPAFALSALRYARRLWSEDRLLARADLTAEQVQGVASRRWAELLRRSFRDVPFYRRRLSGLGGGAAGLAGCVPAELPPLLRRELAAEAPLLRATRPGPAVRHRSSGTTGIPVESFRDEYLLHQANVVLRRHLDRFWPALRLRWRPLRTKCVVLRTASYFGGDTACDGLLTLLPGLGFALEATIALRSSEADVKRLVGFMRVVEPEIVAGDSTTLWLYGDLLKRSGFARQPSAPRLVISTGGHLSSPLRIELEAFFQAAVMNLYSVGEIGWVAASAPGRDGFICSNPSVLVESVDARLRPLPAGRDGLILLTALENFGMPLIRYAPGDVGRIASQPIGPFPALESLNGRAVELLTTRRGGLVHPFDLMQVLASVNLPRHQILQHAVERLSFVTELELSVESRAAVVDVLRRALGDPELEVAFERAEFSAGRKFQPFLSRVPNAYNALCAAPR